MNETLLLLNKPLVRTALYFFLLFFAGLYLFRLEGALLFAFVILLARYFREQKKKNAKLLSRETQ